MSLKRIFLDVSGRLIMEKTPEGYLKGRATVTRPGIFTYIINGKKIRVLRHPDEVLKPESYNTLSMLPATLKHPNSTDPAVVLLDKSTAKKFSVGYSGEVVEVDGQDVSVPLCITDLKTIERIENGDVDISCGYDADYTIQPGMYNNEPYDWEQKNIVYNHIAVGLPAGGSRADVRMQTTDSNDTINSQNFTQTKEGYMLFKFTDGKEHDVPEIVVNDLKKLTDSVATLDATKSELNMARAEIATLKAVDNSKAIAEGVKSRAKLVTQVMPFTDGKEDLTEKSETELKKIVIGKVFSKITLDGKNDETINNLFLAAMEQGTTDSDDDDDDDDSDDGEKKAPGYNKQKAKVMDSRDDQKPRNAREAYNAYQNRMYKRS